MKYKISMSQKLRMDGRDYSRPGWYFVTLGADYHRHYFGAVQDGEMQPNALGSLIESCWAEIPRHYAHITLDAYQVMPNHFHGLVRIVSPGGKGLGEVMNVFKGAVTREWRRRPEADDAVVSRYSGIISRCGEKERGIISRYSEKEREREPMPLRIWAPNYYDVICFEAEELAVKKKYIRANPQRWAMRDVPGGNIPQGRYKGNSALLQQPGERLGLRVSRRADEATVAALKNKLAQFDGIACGTFLSPGEKICLEILLAGKARIIRVLPMTMPAIIPVAWINAFRDSRVLWLSPLPEEQNEVSRASCEQANEWVKEFCEGEPSAT